MAEEPEKDDSAEKDKEITEKIADKKDDSEKATILEDNDDLLDNMPPEAKRIIQMMFSQPSITRHTRSPIEEKITEKHISYVLENSDKENIRNYNSGIHEKWFNAFVVLIAVVLIVFLTIYLAKDNSELYKYILTAVFSFLGGFGGGYGYKSIKTKK